MTKREAIMTALKAKLTSMTSLPDAQVYRSRVEAIARAKSPAVNIEPISDTADNDVIPFLTWTMNVRVSIIVRGSIPDQVADPVIEEVHSKIMSDLSLGGLTMDIRPLSASFELLEGDQPVGVISMDFGIIYRTAVSDLT